MKDKKPKKVLWGSVSRVTFCDFRTLFCLLATIVAPMVVFLFNYSLTTDDGNIFHTLNKLLQNGIDISELVDIYDIRKDSYFAVKIYIIWILYTIFCSRFLPGIRVRGNITPSGQQLEYYCNGFGFFVITLFPYILGVYFNVFDGLFLVDYLPQFLCISSVFGFFVSTIAYIKGVWFPSEGVERGSGNFVFDFFTGLELNPRVCGMDLKLFFGGRPGLTLWTLVNYSFMVKQNRDFGYCTWGMVVCNWLQFLYVIDYFYCEDWYTKTIDVTSDRFGFYFAWGDIVFVPFMYSLQCQYMARNPVEISFRAAIIYFVIGTLSFIGFRLSNNQKEFFKVTNGNCKIWGKDCTYILAPYFTEDGKKRNGKLMTCGFWGYLRRFNYTFDLIIAFCFCGCCGLEDFIPWFYFPYLTFLLIHRLYRDNQRLNEKYGSAWREYKKLVKFWLIPYLL